MREGAAGKMKTQCEQPTRRRECEQPRVTEDVAVIKPSLCVSHRELPVFSGRQTSAFRPLGASISRIRPPTERAPVASRSSHDSVSNDGYFWHTG
jgi:hypothetical protein